MNTHTYLNQDGVPPNVAPLKLTFGITIACKSRVPTIVAGGASLGCGRGCHMMMQGGCLIRLHPVFWQ